MNAEKTQKKILSTSERAGRMAWYLENKYGWNVYEDNGLRRKECINCDYSTNENEEIFCCKCGTLLTNITITQLEKAIAYALGE